MMKSLLAVAVAATAFVQFKNPADNSLLFVTNDDAAKFGATSHEDGYARKDGQKLPIGVKVYGPGSAEYRRAEDKTVSDAIKAGKKALTGASQRADATYKLARTTLAFVNFDYEGETVTAETDVTARVRIASAFFDDGQFVAFRDQVLQEQHDHANFTPTGSSS
jgi:hypothetical protein